MLALALAAVLSADEAPGGSDAPYFERPLESMTRMELRDEYALLEELRPGIGLPITMISVGGGLALYGSALLVSSGSGLGGFNSVFANGNVTGYLFVAMIATGLGLLLPGIWLIWTRRDERRVLGDRMDAITDRLNQIDRASSGSSRERRPQYRPPAPPAEGYQL